MVVILFALIQMARRVIDGFNAMANVGQVFREPIDFLSKICLSLGETVHVLSEILVASLDQIQMGANFGHPVSRLVNIVVQSLNAPDKIGRALIELWAQKVDILSKSV